MKRSGAFGRNWPLFGLLALLIVLIICPLIMVVAKAVIIDGRLDLSRAWAVLATQDNIQTILNSLLLGVSVVAGATIIAAPLAYLFSRTSLKKHRWLEILLLIPFMTPPYIASMGWILFMQKRGLFQQLFPFSGNFSEGFFSFFGLVLVMSLHVFPFMMSILKTAMNNLPASLDEAGAVFGASRSARMRKLTAPLLTGNYAIGALLVFVKTLAEYGTPATLGRRIGFSVFTTDIHRYSTTSPIDFGRSASLSVVLIVICMAMWILQNYITSRNSYRLIGGKGSRTVFVRLSLLSRMLAWTFVGLLLLTAIGIPYFSIITTSLIKLRGYGLAVGNFTLQHYVAMFTENTKGIQAIKNSMILAVTSATICSILGTALVMAVRNSKLRLRKILEGIGLLPEMLPAIVLIIGIMLFWNRIYDMLPLYNTLGIMILAYVVLYLPFTVQYVSSSFIQINDNLIQAGRTFGASPSYIFRRITLPMISRGVFNGWMMIFIIAFRELVTASLIAPPNTLVVSTYIMREFEQGSVSLGMAMTVLCVLITTTAMIVLNMAIHRKKG